MSAYCLPRDSKAHQKVRGQRSEVKGFELLVVLCDELCECCHLLADGAYANRGRSVGWDDDGTEGGRLEVHLPVQPQRQVLCVGMRELERPECHAKPLAVVRRSGIDKYLMG